MSEILTLTRVALRSELGVNKFIYTKDKKEKNRYKLLIGAWTILLCVVFAYSAALVYGLCALGLSETVPSYLIFISCVLIFVFGVFKTSGIVFDKTNYGIIASLPIKTRSIVISRFLTLYFEDILFTFAVVIPGIVVYCVTQKPPVGFCPVTVLGVLFAPCVPLALSLLISVLITALSSRTKHKNAVQIFAGILLAVGAVLLSFNVQDVSELSEKKLLLIASYFVELIGKAYPPAMWLGKSAVAFDMGYLSAFLLISVLSAFTVTAVTSAVFHRVTERLSSSATGRSYRLDKMKNGGALKAMYLREAKRYFSSSVYVINTILGPVFTAIISVSVCVVGIDNVSKYVPFDIVGVIPFALSGVLCMMPASSVSLSMEGKRFWIIRALPVTSKMLFDSKILFCLSLMFPFYAVSEIFILIALKPRIIAALWLVLIPLLMMLFSVVISVAIDIKFHSFDWENETAVVKQSLSTLLGGFVGTVTSFILGAFTFVVPEMYGDASRATVCVLLAAAVIFLYRKNNNTELYQL